MINSILSGVFRKVVRWLARCAARYFFGWIAGIYHIFILQALDQWLQGYANRISVGINLFPFTGVSVILITLLTIGFQAIKAAIANPVKSLTSE